MHLQAEELAAAMAASKGPSQVQDETEVVC